MQPPHGMPHQQNYPPQRVQAAPTTGYTQQQHVGYSQQQQSQMNPQQWHQTQHQQGQQQYAQHQNWHQPQQYPAQQPQLSAYPQQQVYGQPQFNYSQQAYANHQQQQAPQTLHQSAHTLTAGLAPSPQQWNTQQQQQQAPFAVDDATRQLFAKTSRGTGSVGGSDAFELFSQSNLPRDVSYIPCSPSRLLRLSPPFGISPMQGTKEVFHSKISASRFA